MAMSVTSYLSLYAVDHLGIPETAAGMLVALTPAVGFLGSPLGGYFSDRFGSAPVLILMSVLLIPLLFIMGIVSSIVPILAVLVVIGLVSSVCMPVSESFIMGNSPVKRRSTIMGTYYFVSIGLGSLIIPFMGDLIDRFGFQYAYTLAAIVVAAVIIFAFAFMGITGQLKTAIGRR